MIVAAEGPRTPDYTVAQREIRFAFVLLVNPNTTPSPESIAKLDRIRSEWETFFNHAVADRAAAHTQIVRLLQLSAAPAAGLLEGGSGPVRIEIGAPLQ